MNTRTVRTLGIVAIALVAALVVMDVANDSGSTGSGELLLPDLKDRINDADQVTFRRADSTFTIVNDGSRWTVQERNAFPADVGKLREVMLALADARILERKTADPERHGQLGLRSPDVEGSKGVKIEIAGSDFDYSIVIGNLAQTSNRYARIADQDQSWLIDANPDVPTDSSGWLASSILDVDSARVRSVVLTHPDGEKIQISKLGVEDTNFTVDDIPDGRELSYPTVANGIGGVLNDLQLDDVRIAVELADPVVAVFETFDGLEVTVQTVTADDATWIALSATAPEEIEQAGEINARVAGWQYKVVDYKANLLKRRWDDILKKPE